MDENNITLEEKIWAKEKFSDDYELEEFLEDYLPRVKAHIGFKDERRDSRFVVKFHDICYYTNTQDTKDEKADMTQEEFNSLFEMFCSDQYGSTEYVMEDGHMSMNMLFKWQQVGHYFAFEKIIPELTEENYLDIALEIYNEGLSPDYIDGYTKLSDHLQDMEDNYMTYWLEFLRATDIPETTIKNIERRWKEHEEKYNKVTK